MDLALWFLAGVATWVVSVAAKVVASGGAHLLTDARLSDLGYAIVQGATSALCELGAAGAVFALVLPRGSVPLAVAFGAGAGAVEVGFVLIAARAEVRASAAPSEGASAVRGLQRYSFFVERVAALMGHVGSRGLVWLGVHGPFWTAALAFGAFTAVDGAASYGLRRGWEWSNPTTWWRFHTFIVAVGFVEVAAFLALAGVLS